jgi:hypothetical protein
MIADIVPAEAPGSESPVGRLRLRGRNLMSGGPPSVTIGGSPVSVLSATADEVVIAPGPHQLAGELRLSTRADCSVATALDLRPLWARPDTVRADAPPSGGGLS